MEENKSTTDTTKKLENPKKKKGKAKAIFSLILILLCAGAVFIFGWIQFFVPSGSRAVVISKTSGVNDEIVKNGKFIWMWQRLLPTNTEIRVFSEDVFDFSNDYKEKLPSADLFQTMIEQKVDFSYSFKITLKMKATDEKIVDLVKTQNLESERDLKEIYENATKEIASSFLRFLMAENEKSLKTSEIFTVSTLTSSEIAEKLNLASDFPGFEIFEIKIDDVNVPDLKLYELARNSYVKFQASLDENLKRASKEQADKILRDQRTVSTLEQIGEVFKKYPELKEAFKNSSVTDLMELAN